MKADSAMWASKAISDHLRLGVPLEETRATFVSRVFAAILDVSGYDMGPEWEREMPEMGRGLVIVIIERVTGRLIYEITRDLAPYEQEIRDAVEARSWTRLRALPDAVWQYATAVTGMTVYEWDELPEYCHRLLSRRVECPVCQRAESMAEFGEPDIITDPLDLVAREIALVFNCPQCHAEITYDIQRREAEQFGRSLGSRSPLFKWSIIVVAVVIGYFIVRIVFR